jgi:hypothetical protein
VLANPQPSISSTPEGDISDEFSYEADGCSTYVKFMGCWSKDDIDHVETLPATSRCDDGKSDHWFHRRRFRLT